MIKSRMVAHTALRGRRHDTVGASLWCGNAAHASPPAIGRCAVTCRRGHMQERRRRRPPAKPVPEWVATKTVARCVALLGIVGLTTTCVARLAIIPFLSATRFMMDLIIGSFTPDSEFVRAFVRSVFSSPLRCATLPHPPISSPACWLRGLVPASGSPAVCPLRRRG